MPLSGCILMHTPSPCGGLPRGGGAGLGLKGGIEGAFLVTPPRRNVPQAWEVAKLLNCDPISAWMQSDCSKSKGVRPIAMPGGGGGLRAGVHYKRGGGFWNTGSEGHPLSFPLTLIRDRLLEKKLGAGPDLPKFCVKSLFLKDFRHRAMLFVGPARGA